MHFEEQRKLGVRLAKEHGAEKTLAAIKDPNSCYTDILETAASEVGMDKLVSVLKENDPIWATQALTVFSDLGDHHSDLAANSVPINGTASSLELYLASGAAFEASFTMYWFTPGSGIQQPMAGTPDTSQWVWSINLSIAINRSDTVACKDFALENSPLNPGDTVWMVVSTAAGNRFDTGFRFTYEPNGAAVRIDTTGAVASPNFSINTGDTAAAA